MEIKSSDIYMYTYICYVYVYPNILQCIHISEYLTMYTYIRISHNLASRNQNVTWKIIVLRQRKPSTEIESLYSCNNVLFYSCNNVVYTPSRNCWKLYQRFQSQQPLLKENSLYTETIKNVILGITLCLILGFLDLHWRISTKQYKKMTEPF